MRKRQIKSIHSIFFIHYITKQNELWMAIIVDNNEKSPLVRDSEILENEDKK